MPIVKTEIITVPGEQIGMIRMPDTRRIIAYAYDETPDRFGTVPGWLHGTALYFDIGTPEHEMETAVLARRANMVRNFEKLGAAWQAKHG